MLSPSPKVFRILKTTNVIDIEEPFLINIGTFYLEWRYIYRK